MLEVGGTRLANGSRSKSVAKPSARSRVSNGKDLFLDDGTQTEWQQPKYSLPMPRLPRKRFRGCCHQGDDYPLEYYEDGYPKLPACLDRRPITLAEAA
jgi:hypothetical protein